MSNNLSIQPCSPCTPNINSYDLGTYLTQQTPNKPPPFKNIDELSSALLTCLNPTYLCKFFDSARVTECAPQPDYQKIVYKCLIQQPDMPSCKANYAKKAPTIICREPPGSALKKRHADFWNGPEGEAFVKKHDDFLNGPKGKAFAKRHADFWNGPEGKTFVKKHGEFWNGPKGEAFAERHDAFWNKPDCKEKP